MNSNVEHTNRLRDKARKAWNDSSDSQRRAVFHNLMHDDRITENRAKKLLHEWDTNLVENDDQRLVNALQCYCTKHVRGRLDFTQPVDSTQPVTSDSFDRSLNRLNCIDFTQFKDLLDGSKLVRVLNLSKLQTPLVRHHKRLGRQALANGRRVEWNLLPRDNQQFGDWLNKAFAPKSADHDEEIRHRKLVAAELIRVLNEDRKENPYEPAWTALWNDLVQSKERGIDREAHDWANAIGVRVESGDWLVLLQYDLDNVGKKLEVARPSQLDAGPYEFYFPSPAARANKGGHPMSLQFPPASPTGKLLREFLHSSVDHVSEHILEVKQVSVGTDTQSLTELRISHHHRLIKHYKGKVRKWMSDPNDLA